jgi:LPS-assembly protein
MPSRPLRRTALWTAVAAGLLFDQAALAQPPEGCPQPRPIPQRDPRLPDLPTHVRADEAEAVQDGRSEFRGRVEMTRGQNRLRADQVVYDSETDMTQARGNVVLDNETGDSYRTQYLEMHNETRRGHATAGTYTLSSNDARGDMQRVDFLDADHARLTEVRYTTCAPGQDDWYLIAPRMEIDNLEEMAYVRNARVEFKGVPIYYLPFGAFSISNKRKSGFLTPSFGYTSRNGIDVTTPYYFNLAPNYDATVTPRVMGLRGLLLQNEFRYLTRQLRGQVDLGFLPDDRLRDRDPVTGQPLNKDRYAGKYVHAHTFNPLWTANVNLQGVSDKDYLREFGNNLNIIATTHLPQNAEVNYRGSIWNFTARLNDHQTVDKTIPPESRPYARLPQLALSANTPTVSGQTQYHFSSELVRFHRAGVSITGNRLNLMPAVSYPMLRSYGFLTPRVGARYIGYNLSGTPDTSPSVAAGFFSLDGGLFLDRGFAWGGHNYTQTLEPRIYYLYTPHKNQNHLPNFDSGAPGISFPGLFRDQRLDGGDRIGDANQITLALTSRVLDAGDGAERLRGSIGRIYYFADRRVNIPAGLIRDRNSDLVAEGAARLRGNWFATADAVVARDVYKTRQSNIYLQYNPARNKIVNIGQRYYRSDIRQHRSSDLHQRDISFEWPLIARWSIRARALDSLREDRSLESYVGAQYQSCCWAFRAIGGRRLIEADLTVTPNRYKHAKFILFELELTGLAKHSRGGEFPDSPRKQSVFSTFPGEALPPPAPRR